MNSTALQVLLGLVFLLQNIPKVIFFIVQLHVTHLETFLILQIIVRGTGTSDG